MPKADPSRPPVIAPGVEALAVRTTLLTLTAIAALGKLTDQSEALAAIVAREKVPGLAVEATQALGRQKDAPTLKRLLAAVTNWCQAVQASYSFVPAKFGL
mgnify:CR=1 FL=1